MNVQAPGRNIRNLSHDEIVRAVALVNDGRSQRYVARLIGVQQSTISRIVNRFTETGEYTRRPGQGRKRATTARDDRFLRLNATRTRHLTAKMLQIELQTVRNVAITSQTVRNRLREVGIYARVPVKGPMLTREHRIARLHFAREHALWNVDDWANILFTDESRFCLFSSDRRIPVYRRAGERYSPWNFRNTQNFGGGSIMVWGGISLESHTELFVVHNGAMTAHRYVTEVLDPHVIPYAPFIGPNFRLMHDNAQRHVANIVQQHTNDVGIRVLEWPARSPDLNPIEHVWDRIGFGLKTGQAQAQTLEQLEATVTEEWNRLSQDYIRGLIESMPRRMQNVINARGGNTRY